MYTDRELVDQKFKIYSTKNYDRFHFLSRINRPVDEKILTKLKRALKILGNKKTVMVAKLSFPDGVEREYIIDGQHFFTLAQRLGLWINYQLIEIGDNPISVIESITTFNNSGKSWDLDDFVTAWSYIIPDYRRLHSSHHSFSIPYIALGAIALNKESRSSISPIIKKGNLRIMNEQYDDIVKFLDEIYSVIGQIKNNGIKERVGVAFLRYFNNRRDYDHQHTLEAVSIKKQLILDFVGDNDDIYHLLATEIFI